MTTLIDDAVTKRCCNNTLQGGIRVLAIDRTHQEKQNSDLEALMTLPEDVRERLIMIALGMTLRPVTQEK